MKLVQCHHMQWMTWFIAFLIAFGIIGDSKSYLSALPQLHINVWAYFGRYFLALFSIKRRKVIRPECPCIIVLSIETSSFLNVETEPRMEWCGDGETRKIEKWLPFRKYALSRKMSNDQPSQSLGLQLSECGWKWNISISHYEIIEKWPPFLKYASYRKISSYQPPKFGSQVFQVSKMISF